MKITITVVAALHPSIHPSIHPPTPSLQPVRTLGQGCEWDCNDVLVMADCIILQNAPRGPLLGRQLLCMLNVIILCLPALRLIYCEWREREQKCTVSERDCWLIQNHRHLLLGKVALWLHTQKNAFSVA